MILIFAKGPTTQVFSCEICEIFKNTFFYRYFLFWENWCSRKTFICSFLCEVDILPISFSYKDNILGHNFTLLINLYFCLGSFPVYDILVEKRNVCVDHHGPHTFHICLYWCPTLHGMFLTLFYCYIVIYLYLWCITIRKELLLSSKLFMSNLRR